MTLWSSWVFIGRETSWRNIVLAQSLQSEVAEPADVDLDVLKRIAGLEPKPWKGKQDSLGTVFTSFRSHPALANFYTFCAIRRYRTRKIQEVYVLSIWPSHEVLFQSFPLKASPGPVATGPQVIQIVCFIHALYVLNKLFKPPIYHTKADAYTH